MRDAAHGLDRRHQHQLWRKAARRLAHDARERAQSQRLHALGGHHDERRRSVVDARGVAGGNRAATLEGGFQLAERVDGRVGTNWLVAIHRHGRTLFLREHDWQNLVLEGSCVGGARRSLMAARGILVLCSAVDVILVGNDLARVPHVALLECAPQTISDHGMDHFAVPHPQPITNAR